MKIVVIGAGIFGSSAAVELAHRGHSVCLVDDFDEEIGDGSRRASMAATNDISKLIRAEYGEETIYSHLMKIAWSGHDGSYLPGWAKWNQTFGVSLVRPVGIQVLSDRPLEQLDSRSFERASWDAMASFGMPVSQYNGGDEVSKDSFGLFSPSTPYGYGFRNHFGGWAMSGAVADRLLVEGRSLGVAVVRGRATIVYEGEEEKSRAIGVSLDNGQQLDADFVVVSAGAFTPLLVPSLRRTMHPCGQFVVHFAVDGHEFPANDAAPGYCTSIQSTGRYGFPVTQTGILKIGSHGTGYPFVEVSGPKRTPMAPSCASSYPTPAVLGALVDSVREAEVAAAREFVRTAINPRLADASVAKCRICCYCDSFDGHFLIDRHPVVENLIVAAGGSGHGFKFGPVVGFLVADKVERKPWSQPFPANLESLFAWREPSTNKSPTDSQPADQARNSAAATTQFQQRVDLVKRVQKKMRGNL